MWLETAALYLCKGGTEVNLSTALGPLCSDIFRNNRMDYGSNVRRNLATSFGSDVVSAANTHSHVAVKPVKVAKGRGAARNWSDGPTHFMLFPCLRYRFDLQTL